MKRAMPQKQRGLSFVGFIIGAVMLVLASVLGLKVIPAYMQNEQVKNLFITLANDPEMKKGSQRDILTSFNKRASIDNITAVKAEDIEIVKDENRLILSASYSHKVPLAGNVSLCLDFSVSSAK